jgi:hypothetical protein
MEWTAENLRWFFGQSPPRQVDEDLLDETLNVLFPKIARIAFCLLPVLVLATMGMSISVLVKTTDLSGEWRVMMEPAALASGRVLRVDQNKSSKGSITYVYYFEFKPVGREGANDPPFKGICLSGDPIASPGQTVTIEYLPDDPKVSRLHGCRLTSVPLALILVMLGLGVSVAIFPIGMLRYKRKWLQRLLTLGVLTQAMIEKVKPGPKGSLVVALRYTVSGAEFKSKTNTRGRKDEREWLTSLLESGSPMTILVDPGKPKSLFLIDPCLSGCCTRPQSLVVCP